MSEPPRLRDLPLAASRPASDPPMRHETVLPDEPAEARAALAAALPSGGRTALAGVCARWPGFLEAWARLGEHTLAGGDAVTAYAFARVGYHRGLDRLRREGWGGTGLVRWAQPSNRGFLRALRLLLASAAALGELDESTRCRQFLLDLDPDDALGAAAYPPIPGADWRPPPLPL